MARSLPHTQREKPPLNYTLQWSQRWQWRQCKIKVNLQNDHKDGRTRSKEWSLWWQCRIKGNLQNDRTGCNVGSKEKLVLWSRPAARFFLSCEFDPCVLHVACLFGKNEMRWNVPLPGFGYWICSNRLGQIAFRLQFIIAAKMIEAWQPCWKKVGHFGGKECFFPQPFQEKTILAEKKKYMEPCKPVQ